MDGAYCSVTEQAQALSFDDISIAVLQTCCVTNRAGNDPHNNQLAASKHGPKRANFAESAVKRNAGFERELRLQPFPSSPQERPVLTPLRRSALFVRGH